MNGMRLTTQACMLNVSEWERDEILLVMKAAQQERDVAAIHICSLMSWLRIWTLSIIYGGPIHHKERCEAKRSLGVMKSCLILQLEILIEERRSPLITRLECSSQCMESRLSRSRWVVLYCNLIVFSRAPCLNISGSLDNSWQCIANRRRCEVLDLAIYV